MSAALEEISQQALRLPRKERLALASLLLSDSADMDASASEAAWDEEIDARIQAIDDGTAAGIPYEDVISAARCPTSFCLSNPTTN